MVNRRADLWKSFGSLNDYGCISYNKTTFDAIFCHAEFFKHLYFNGDFKHLVLQVSMEYIYKTLATCCNVIVLDLTSNFIIEDISFIVYLPLLQDLSIEWCVNLKPVTARAVLTSEDICPNLKMLNMRKCDQFTKFDILSIAFFRSSLEKLNISDVERYSVQCVRNIVEILPCLETLIISADILTNDIQEWEDLKRQFPFLSYYVV